jgi:hypothetical protein
VPDQGRRHGLGADDCNEPPLGQADNPPISRRPRSMAAKMSWALVAPAATRWCIFPRIPRSERPWGCCLSGSPPGCRYRGCRTSASSRGVISAAGMHRKRRCGCFMVYGFHAGGLQKGGYDPAGWPWGSGGAGGIINGGVVSVVSMSNLGGGRRSS